MSKVVQYILRVKDEASRTTERTADAAKDAASALSTAGREAEEFHRKAAGAGTGAARAVVQATDAEKSYIAQLVAGNAVTKARAEGLGITVAQLRQMDDALQDAGAQAGAVAARLRTADAAVGSVGAGMATASKSTAGMGRAAAAVAQQLPDVFTQLSMGANPLQVIAIQGGQVAQQFNLVGLAGKALSAVASPLGLALAAVGTAAVVVANETADSRRELDRYTDGLGDADRATRRLIQSQNALKLATGDVAGFVADLQIQTALLSGDVSDADVRAGELGGTLADMLRPKLLAAGQAFAQNEADITRYREAVRSGKLNAGEMAQAQIALDQALSRREGLQSTLDGIKQLGGEGRTAINSYTNALEASAEAANETADAVERVAAAASKVASLDLSSAAGVMAAGVQAPTTFDRIDGSAVEQAFAQAMADADLSGAFTQALRAGSTLAQRAGGAAAQGASVMLNPAGAVGAAGPIGAGLAALARVGEMGTDRIIQQLTEFGRNIVDGLALLPELFGRLLVELPVAIGEKVADALSNLLTPGGGGFQPFKGKLTVREILGLGSLGMTELTGLGVAADAAFGGDQGFAAGDTRFINRTGMAVVHQGERITRSNGGTSGGIMSGGRGGGPQIIIQAAAVTPDVLQGLGNQLGAQYDPGGWGRGTRTVFGG